ncbi:YSIRK-type signal peptide-containing protein, partial [Streptococcus sp. ZJ100]|uniref:YSIRK-type signal peptide-containing protein n=1 Tax=Streptococcus handemini TaxID=3161188 RepID=UPI0032EFC4E0
MFYRKKDRFSIRKFKVGVCSVFLGSLFLVAQQVHALENAETAEVQPAIELVSDSVANQASASTEGTGGESVSHEMADSTVEESTSTEEEEIVASSVSAIATEVSDEVENVAAVVTSHHVEHVAADTDLPADEIGLAKIREIAKINDYKLLSASVRADFIRRINEATDEATLEVIVKEASRAKLRDETFPKEGEDLPEGTYFRAESSADTHADATTPKTQDELDKEAFKNYTITPNLNAPLKDPNENRFTFWNIEKEVKSGEDEPQILSYAISIDRDVERFKEGERATEGFDDIMAGIPKTVYLTAFDAQGQQVGETKSFSMDVDEGEQYKVTLFGADIDPDELQAWRKENQIYLKFKNTKKLKVSYSAFSTNINPTIADGKQLPLPKKAKQVTNYYLAGSDNKVKVHESHEQAGDYFKNDSYTTVPLKILGYKLVGTNGNQDGKLAVEISYRKGEWEAVKQRWSAGNFSGTMYKFNHYIDNKGTLEMTVFSSPKLPHQLPTASELLEDYLKSPESRKYTFEMNKAYLLQGTEEIVAKENKKYRVRDSDLAKYPELKDYVSKDANAFYAFHEGTYDKLLILENNDYVTKLEVGKSTSLPRPLIIRNPASKKLILASGITIENAWSLGSRVDYEYAKIEKVEAEYYADDTGTRLYENKADYTNLNPEAKLVKEDIPGVEYTDTPPERLTDKDGVEYELVRDGEKPALLDNSAPQSGKIENTVTVDGENIETKPQVIRYRYRRALVGTPDQPENTPGEEGSTEPNPGATPGEEGSTEPNPGATPGGEEDKPEVETPDGGSTDPQPDPSGPQPGGEEDKPEVETPDGGSTDPQPDPSGPQPGGEEDKPEVETPDGGSTDPQPDPSGPQPEGEPGNGGDTPSGNEGTPDEGGSTPGGEEDKPEVETPDGGSTDPQPDPSGPQPEGEPGNGGDTPSG